jgi:hypothetical protein
MASPSIRALFSTTFGIVLSLSSKYYAPGCGVQAHSSYGHRLDGAGPPLFVPKNEEPMSATYLPIASRTSRDSVDAQIIRGAGGRRCRHPAEKAYLITIPYLAASLHCGNLQLNLTVRIISEVKAAPRAARLFQSCDGASQLRTALPMLSMSGRSPLPGASSGQLERSLT